MSRVVWRLKTRKGGVVQFSLVVWYQLVLIGLEELLQRITMKALRKYYFIMIDWQSWLGTGTDLFYKPSGELRLRPLL